MRSDPAKVQSFDRRDPLPTPICSRPRYMEVSYPGRRNTKFPYSISHLQDQARTWFTYESRGTQVIKGVSSSAAKKIEELQPFQASTAPEDDPLWQIHELNNIDKHRFLITTRACLGRGNFHLKFDPPIPDGVKASSMQGEIIENGTIFMSLSPIRPTKVQINGRLSVEIVLNETRPC